VQHSVNRADAYSGPLGYILDSYFACFHNSVQRYEKTSKKQKENPNNFSDFSWEIFGQLKKKP
jgi:hypothetical protein